MKIKLLILLAFINALPLRSQLFEEVNSRIEGTLFGKVTWADTDGDLDIFINGLGKNNKKRAELRLNIGNLLFPDFQNNFIPVFRGDCIFAKVNEDSLPDIIYSGLDDNFKVRTFIYLNSKGNNFNYYKELDGFVNGKVIAADFNQDKSLDILLIGKSSRKRECLLYLSQSGKLSKVILKLGGIMHPAISAFDYNGDSLPDLIVAGRDISFKRITRVYLNKNNGVFELIKTPLAKFSSAAISSEDIDKNGFKDLLITGSTSKGRKTKLYLNQGGKLVESAVNIEGITRGATSFIDFDNDGDMDMIVCGMGDDKPITKVYENQNGDFRSVKQEFVGLYDSSIDIGDMDNDGDSDFIINGRTENGNYLCIIYKNLNIK